MQIHSSPLADSLTIQFDQTQQAAPAPAPHSQDNGLSEHQQLGGSTVSSGTSPSEGAREATEAQPSTRAELNRLAEERALENENYVEAKRLLELCGDLETSFLNMDKETFWPDDQALIYTDIKAILEGGLASDKAKVFAQLMRDNPSIWSRLAGDDNKVGVKDVRNFIAGLKETVRTIKQQALAEVKAEQGVPAAGSAAQAEQASAANQAGGVPAEGPKPEGSTKPGLDGAMENLDNMAAWFESELAKVNAELAEDPTNAELQKKAAKLQQQQTAIVQMQVQLMTMMSNLAKMWSDVSRNAIQNLR